MNTLVPIKQLSFRQLRAIDLWLRNGRKNKAKALRQAGYSKSVCRQPQKVFDSPAVQRELERRGYGSSGIGNDISAQERYAVTKEKVGTATFNFLMDNIDTVRERLYEIGYEPSYQRREDTFDRSDINYRTDLTLDGTFVGNNSRSIDNDISKYSSM